ncbi:MAG: HAMP domain-containing sensor histidine kinase [Rikenellaceae bacterium]
MKLSGFSITFRNRAVVIVGLLLGVVILLVSGNMARTLHQKERHDIHLWAHAMERINQDLIGRSNLFFDDIVSPNQNIPFIMTDEDLKVITSHLIDPQIINHPDRLRAEIERLSEENQPVVVNFLWSDKPNIIFFGRSRLLSRLYYFPVVQLVTIAIFLILCFIAITNSKHLEQNRVWVGLAKETAHQLGTPTSSLLGWIEYLRTQPIDPSVVDEMNKDLTHLLKIVDRFSKIGSDTPLAVANINEVVGETVMYFKHRIPRNVKLTYNGFAMAPIEVMINTALFEWVVENLLKNALDALQGQGTLDVSITSTEQEVMIDVKDSGKGIPKGNWRKIFEPGFTTKTRGWGLGLSLSRRIVEEYHDGRIAVVESEIGGGTTIRVTLKRHAEQ